jgi:Fe2+ or Zn2+ uptake regulation protein
MSFDKLPVLQAWRSRGRRVTAARRAVLEGLCRAGCAADVRTVYRLAKQVHPRLGLVTVYRTLDLLAREGWVQRWEEGGVARYELDQPHHHHLVCLGCGEVRRWDRCPVPVGAGATVGGFLVTGHRLELLGYCSTCTEAMR